jgi:hypothetical protein
MSRSSNKFQNRKMTAKVNPPHKKRPRVFYFRMPNFFQIFNYFCCEKYKINRKQPVQGSSRLRRSSNIEGSCVMGVGVLLRNKKRAPQVQKEERRYRQLKGIKQNSILLHSKKMMGCREPEKSFRTFWRRKGFWNDLRNTSMISPSLKCVFEVSKTLKGFQ